MYLSAETAINIVPVNIQFCTAGVDFKLRIFKGDLTNENTCQVRMFRILCEILDL